MALQEVANLSLGRTEIELRADGDVRSVANCVSVGTKVATSIAPPLTDGGSPYVFSITDGDIPLPAEYSNVMNKWFNPLSEGQRKKVALARS